jgi:hypothetical protein
MACCIPNRKETNIQLEKIGFRSSERQAEPQMRVLVRY